MLFAQSPKTCNLKREMIHYWAKKNSILICLLTLLQHLAISTSRCIDECLLSKLKIPGYSEENIDEILAGNYDWIGTQYVFNKNIRHLLADESNDASNQAFNERDCEESEFDLLNQRTYDGYDWFLFVFIHFVIGMMWFLSGWCLHKKRIANKILHDKDIESLESVILASTPGLANEDVAHKDGNEKRKYTFAGFNIVGEEIKSKVSVELALAEQVPSDTTTNTATSTTNAEFELTLVAYSAQSSSIDDTCIQQESQPESPPPLSYLNVQNSIILNLDQSKRPTVPIIIVPPLTADIVPLYEEQRDVNINCDEKKVEIRQRPSQSETVGDFLQSPDTNEPSESHLSYDVVRGDQGRMTLIIAPNTPPNDMNECGDLSDFELVYQGAVKRRSTNKIDLHIIVEEHQEIKENQRN